MSVASVLSGPDDTGMKVVLAYTRDACPRALSLTDRKIYPTLD